jgi:protein-tyrosine phosphatase
MNRFIQRIFLVWGLTSSITIFSQEKSTANMYNVYAFPQTKKSTIYLSPLPGRVNMTEDLTKITQNNVKNVVVLVSKEELEHYKVPRLLAHYDSLHLNVFHSPIVDYGLPSMEQMRAILTFINSKVKAKENVLVHCVGGYGRSGTVMGCYARQYLKKTDEEAITYVRSIRGTSSIETAEQVDFVKKWFN